MGCLNSTLSMATVTTGPGCNLCASIAAARSISERIAPPKTVPIWLASCGVVRRRMVGMRSAGKLVSALMAGQRSGRRRSVHHRDLGGQPGARGHVVQGVAVVVEARGLGAHLDREARQEHGGEGRRER